MKVSLNIVKEFVITARNEDNSVFYIRPKSDVEKEINDNVFAMTQALEGFWDEEEIITSIEEKGCEFYTYSKANGFTDVIVVDGHLKTKGNDITEDNIGSLPVL